MKKHITTNITRINVNKIHKQHEKFECPGSLVGSVLYY